MDTEDIIRIAREMLGYRDDDDDDMNYIIEQTKSACVHCSNNPINGGSGICHCVLGTPVIT